MKKLLVCQCPIPVNDGWGGCCHCGGIVVGEDPVRVIGKSDAIDRHFRQRVPCRCEAPQDDGGVCRRCGNTIIKEETS